MKYIGVKLIEAIKESKDGKDGYKVGYYESIKTDKVVYESWSPKEVFEEAYRQVDNLNFGIAIELMKKGYKLARKGWNGKGMFIYIQNGTTITKDMARNHILKDIDGDININSHIDMKSADDSIVIGWLASQTDMLSDDWYIVK